MYVYILPIQSLLFLLENYYIPYTSMHDFSDGREFKDTV